MGFNVGKVVGGLVGGGAGFLVGSNYDAMKGNAAAAQGAANTQAWMSASAAKSYRKAAEKAKLESEKAAQTRRTEDIAAAEKAAQEAEKALMDAIPLIEADIQNGADISNAEFASAVSSIREGLTPYMQTGSEANKRLQSMMFGTDQDRKNAFQLDPGYQFRLDQGQKVRERSAASRGDLFSGKTGVELEQYGQDFASDEFNNAFTRLMNLSATGQNATNTMGSYDWQNAAMRGANAEKVAGVKAQNQTNLANTRGKNAWNIAETTQAGNQAVEGATSRGAWGVADARNAGTNAMVNAGTNLSNTNAEAQMAKNNFLPNTLNWIMETGIKLAPLAAGAMGGAPGAGAAAPPGNAFTAGNTYRSTYSLD